MIELLRTILPSNVRKKVGEVIDKHPLLFLPVIWLIFRMLVVPISCDKFLIISSKVRCKVRKKGWIIFQEIFRDRIYEKYYNIKTGDVVIDVGANVGLFTLKVIKTVGRKGLCIAIEPEPSNFKLLEENTKRYANVIRLQVAVGNTNGSTKLYLAETSGEHSIKEDYGLGYITVEMKTLDRIVEELNLERIDFIKIDVEGAEVEVLEGAKKTLSSYHPKIVLEYHSIQDLRKIIEILRNLGYSCKINSDNENSKIGYIYAWRDQQ